MKAESDAKVTDILGALFGNEPFFGNAVSGFLGDSRRHIGMIAAVHLAETGHPINVLEIGSGVGSSAMSFAQAITYYGSVGGSLTCVDSWKAYFSQRDIDEREVYRQLTKLFELDLVFNLFIHNTRKIKDRIYFTPLRGTSADILPTLKQASFDLIYIDGSHYYEDVVNDLRCSERLLRTGGILCGDDLELQLGMYDVDMANKSKDADVVLDPQSGRRFHPGVALATSEFFGRVVSSMIGFWAVRKKASGFEDVTFLGLESLIPDHLPAVLQEECRALFGDPPVIPASVC